MAIHCIFHTPEQQQGCRCQVLALGRDAERIMPQTLRAVERRYCTSGRFIACPIFMRVERGLHTFHRMRGQRQAGLPAPPPPAAAADAC